MIEVAKEHFGFKEDEKLASVCADAWTFIDEYKGDKFDALFMDVNFEEDNVAISPPVKFLQPEFLEKTLDQVQDGGYLAINLLIDDKKDLEMVLGFVRQVKGARKFMSKATEDKNIVIMMHKGYEGKMPTNDRNKSAEKRLASFKDFVKAQGLNSGVILNKSDFMFLHHVEAMSEIKKDK